jgi:hypothetical protein
MAAAANTKAAQARRSLRFRALAPSVEPRVNRFSNFARSKLEPQISEN